MKRSKKHRRVQFQPGRDHKPTTPRAPREGDQAAQERIKREARIKQERKAAKRQRDAAAGGWQ